MERKREPNMPPENEFRFGRTVQMVANLFRRLGDENLSAHGINTSQLRILGYLSRNGKDRDIYQKELEEAFGVRRSSITSILQNMEKAGYLVREGSPLDARVKRVLLTRKGMELDDQLRSFIHNLEEAMVEGISEEEKAVVQKALLGMLSNLENIERKKG